MIRSTDYTRFFSASPCAGAKPVRLVRLLRQKIVIVVLAVSLLTASGLLLRTFAMRQPSILMPLPYAFVESPNCDDRPADAEINCIVLHATVEPTTEGTMGIFLTPSRRVSAHFVVGKDGRVVQMVPIEKRAWHAGPSVLEGARGVNDFSVGIEIVNLNDGKDPYTPEQMQAVAGIIRLVRSRYTIPDTRIVSHAQIALPAGRKSDPIGLDFDKIRAMAREDAQFEKEAEKSADQSQGKPGGAAGSPQKLPSPKL